MCHLRSSRDCVFGAISSIGPFEHVSRVLNQASLSQCGPLSPFEKRAARAEEGPHTFLLVLGAEEPAGEVAL